jgi:type III polyketide synthase
VCTTCTATHHPGYDLYVHQRLGLKPSAKRILLHGIGCAGGLSLVRVARDICLSAQMQSRKARVLIVAVEVVSSLLRTELQRLDEEDEKGGTKPNIASTIFADGASAMIVASGKMEASGEYPYCTAKHRRAHQLIDQSAQASRYLSASKRQSPTLPKF